MNVNDPTLETSPYRQLMGIACELSPERVRCVVSYAKKLQKDALFSQLEQSKSREQQEASLPIGELTAEEEKAVAQSLEEIKRGEGVRVDLREHPTLRDALPSGFEEMM